MGSLGGGNAQDVLEAVRSSLANMTVEVDLQEVEDLIRRTVAEGPPIATPRDVARVLAKLVPTANDIADQVAVKVVEKMADKLADQMAATVSSALSSTISSTQLVAASPAGAANATSGHDRRLVSALLEAMERLATEMHDVRDQVRKSRTQLDTFEGRLNRLGQSDRGLETLRDALTGDLDRLGQRLEQQIKEAADSGEPVPDGEQIANLSRRLRRSSIYLDRVLGRLDQLISHQAIGGPPGNGTTSPYTASDAGALIDDDDDLGPTRFAVRNTPAEPQR
jgi:small-conductance mechanosensitive channel